MSELLQFCMKYYVILDYILMAPNCSYVYNETYTTVKQHL